MHDIERRNRAIRKHFYDLLGTGLPIMVAYAMTGQEFYLGEERIRQIVAKRNCWYNIGKVYQQKIDFCSTFAASFERCEGYTKGIPKVYKKLVEPISV